MPELREGRGRQELLDLVAQRVYRARKALVDSKNHELLPGPTVDRINEALRNMQFASAYLRTLGAAEPTEREGE